MGSAPTRLSLIFSHEELEKLQQACGLSTRPSLTLSKVDMSEAGQLTLLITTKDAVSNSASPHEIAKNAIRYMFHNRLWARHTEWPHFAPSITMGELDVANQRLTVHLPVKDDRRPSIKRGHSDPVPYQPETVPATQALAHIDPVIALVRRLNGMLQRHPELSLTLGPDGQLKLRYQVEVS